MQWECNKRRRVEDESEENMEADDISFVGSTSCSGESNVKEFYSKLEWEVLGKVENIVETTINRMMEKDESRNKWAGVNLNEVESRDALNGGKKSSGACLSQREMKFMNDLTEYVGSNVYSTKTKWTNVDCSVVKTEPDMQDEDDVKLSEESEQLKKKFWFITIWQYFCK